MSIENVRKYLRAYGMEARVLEFPVSSATVELAAQAVHCEAARIAKTLSFAVQEHAVLIVAAGDARIDNHKFKEKFHMKAKMLSADEVLELVYQKMIREVRKSLTLPWQEGTDFFTHVRQVAAQTVIASYDCKENLSQFVFESDSTSKENFRWWTAEIKKLIAVVQKEGQIAPNLDADSLSYASWCFIRGFNADAMARSLSKEDALRRFDYGFGIFLKGIRA